MALGLLASYQASCGPYGAFADATDNLEGNPTLQFIPDNYIYQHQEKEVTIQFAKLPPWEDIVQDDAYISQFDPPEGVTGTYVYDNYHTLQCILQALRNAPTGQRIFRVAAVYQPIEIGGKTMRHAGWGVFWVLSRNAPSTASPDGQNPSGGAE